MFLLTDSGWLRSDGVGQPKKPPCVSCHHSGSNCVLSESRRGRHLRASQPKGREPENGFDGSIARAGDDILSAPGRSQTPSHGKMPASLDASAMNDYDEFGEHTADENLHMELRNPSDALKILARSYGSASILHSTYSKPQTKTQPPGNAPTHPSKSISLPSTPAVVTTKGPSQALDSIPSLTTVLDDYELVQRGLLHPGVLPELLLM